MKKAYLMHISHYDPAWIARKETEEPFDVEISERILHRLKEYSFDAVVIDCADGLEYETHPELRRPYTVSKELMSGFVNTARELDMDIIPKLNFSKSGRNRHDMWMAPHVDLIDWTGSVDSGIYWKVAEDLINELVDFFKPKCFFHIGMDEDHYRSVNQYAETIVKLDSMIKKHNLRTMIWNDSCYDRPDSPNKHHADKCRDAEKLLPQDVAHVLWEYQIPVPNVLKRLKNEGFEAWVAPGKSPEKVMAWLNCVKKYNGDGILMTNWKKCSTANRDSLLELIDKIAPSYSRD